MNTFLIDNFLARSSDATFGNTQLGKVLSKLPKATEEGPWLAGGALRRTLMQVPLDSDYDFFFRDENQEEKFVSELEDLGFKKVKTTIHHQQFEGTVNVPGKTESDPGTSYDVKVQAIRFGYWETPQAVIDNFDFTICQFAYDGKNLYCGDFALWDLGRKRLAIHKITFPLSTMRRIIKYTQQGFVACNGCLTQILRATETNPDLVNQLNIAYVD